MTQRVARNTLYLTIASVGQKIISFVYFLFLARVMMPEATGEYFLVTSMTMIFSVIADVGITSVIIREIAKDERRAPSLITHAIGLKIPFILLAIVGMIVSGYLLGYEEELRRFIMLAGVILFLDAIHLFFYGILRGFQSLQYESIGVFAGMLTTACFGGLVLWLTPSLPLLIIALMVGSFVNVCVPAIKIVKHFGPRIFVPAWSRRESWWMMKTAIPFALAAIFVKVYSSVDSILISKLLDITAVGFYAIAYKFTYAFQFLPLAFVAALYPGMSSVMGRDREALEHTFVRSMWYMAILSAPIVFGLYAVAEDVILLAGEEYRSSIVVLEALVFVLIPLFLDFPIGSLLNAADRQATKTTIMGLTMLINIILNIVLIPRMGVLGAAYASLVSFCFMLLLGLLFVPRIIPRFSFMHLLRTILPIYFSGVVMLIVVLLLKPFIGWILVMPIGALIYLALLFSCRSMKTSDLSIFRRV